MPIPFPVRFDSKLLLPLFEPIISKERISLFTGLVIRQIFIIPNRLFRRARRISSTSYYASVVRSDL